MSIVISGFGIIHETPGLKSCCEDAAAAAAAAEAVVFSIKIKVLKQI